eukprot:scaffold3332_cov80-Skeletonema_marinoi.AAC.1
MSDSNKISEAHIHITYSDNYIPRYVEYGESSAHILCIHFDRLSLIDNKRLEIVICLDQEELTAAT